MNPETKLGAALVAIAILGAALVAIGAGLLNAKLAAILTGAALIYFSAALFAAIYQNRK